MFLVIPILITSQTFLGNFKAVLQLYLVRIIERYLIVMFICNF